jgi:hypothetical protein
VGRRLRSAADRDDRHRPPFRWSRLDLNANDSEPRRRFTASHEIIHTVFPGFKREARYRTDTSAEANPRNREEEYLCDLGAAALLMPRAIVTKRLSGADGLAAVQVSQAGRHTPLQRGEDVPNPCPPHRQVRAMMSLSFMNDAFSLSYGAEASSARVSSWL